MIDALLSLHTSFTTSLTSSPFHLPSPTLMFLLFCIPSHPASLRFTSLHFSLPFTSSTLHFLHYTTLHCTPSHATLHDTTLHDTTLHYASLPFSSHHFIPSHFTLIFLLLLLLCIDAVAAMFYSQNTTSS